MWRWTLKILFHQAVSVSIAKSHEIWIMLHTPPPSSDRSWGFPRFPRIISTPCRSYYLFVLLTWRFSLRCYKTGKLELRKALFKYYQLNTFTRHFTCVAFRNNFCPRQLMSICNRFTQRCAAKSARLSILDILVSYCLKPKSRSNKGLR